jgi:hypothetical protein
MRYPCDGSGELTKIIELSCKDCLNILLICRKDVGYPQERVLVGNRTGIDGPLNRVCGELLCFIGRKSADELVDSEGIPILLERRLFAIELSCFCYISAGSKKGREEEVEDVGNESPGEGSNSKRNLHLFKLLAIEIERASDSFVNRQLPGFEWQSREA